jgi:hypothetical protein
MRFSPSTNCFYPLGIDYQKLPDDLIELPESDYVAAMTREPGLVIRLSGNRLVMDALPPPSPEVLQKAAASRITDAIQAYIDAPAIAWGYDDARSAVSYVGDSFPRFDAEGQAIKVFRSDCWRIADLIRESVLAGERVLPSVDEMLAMLPEPPARPGAAD